MRIAIVIGHEKSRPGAYSKHLRMSEYLYNSEVAPYFTKVGADIYKRPSGGGYKTQMRKLSEEINKKNYDLVIDLHFNSYEEVGSAEPVEGCEVLTYKGNTYSQMLGERICKAIEIEYGSNNRGVKQITNPLQRGYWFLYFMKANAMILEPFFGDEEEALKFKNPGKYAKVVMDTLCG